MTALTLKGISLNLSTMPRDIERLMVLSGKGDIKTKEEVQEWYDIRVRNAFQDGKLYGQDVDFYCLQEFFPHDLEKKKVVQILLNAGFSILGDSDLGIAFKTDQFVLKNARYTTKNGSGALYAILKHKESGEEICLVSDHVKGFDARKQKALTAAKKRNASVNPITNQAWEANAKQEGPLEGNQAIAHSLTILKDNNTSTLFIEGLDANATAKYLKDRVHPKRMDLFSQNGWVFDTADLALTIIDHCLEDNYMQKDQPISYKYLDTYLKEPRVALKYDYICAKAPWGHQINITSRPLGPEPSQYSELISDHRPVFAKIEIKKTWMSVLWSCYKFLRLFNLLTLCRKLFPSTLLKKESSQASLSTYPDLKKDENYLFLSREGVQYFELLVMAEVSSSELREYSHDLSTNLTDLASERNKTATYQYTPAQISELFAVSCILKKFQIPHIGLHCLPKHPNQVLQQLKQGIQTLLKKKSPTAPEAKVQRYIREQMKDSILLQEVTLWTADNIV
jgi:hypothetical protein